MRDNLQDPPVSENVGLNAQHSLAKGEGDLDGDPEESGQLEADVLHHEDEGDHEAADAAHPGDEPQQPKPICAPGASAESSRSVVGKTWKTLIKLSTDKSRARIQPIAASQRSIAGNISP